MKMDTTNNKNISKIVAVAAVFMFTFAGCLGGSDDSDTPQLIQTGSSTVLPLAVAWAEEYDGAEITVSGGGSSHGLNALLSGEADLGDASRLLKGKDYAKFDSCDAEAVNEDGSASESCNGVMPKKWVVAFDVLAVITHPDNDWATNLNYTQLYAIFTDDNPAVNWNDVPGLEDAPSEKIEIYSPDEASGTFDYFFEEIIPNWGKDDQQAGTRLESGDGVYNPSADDNVVLEAIKNSKYAIGYFGFAYYIENQESISSVNVWNDYESSEEKYVTPSFETVADYPMARPIFVYTDDLGSKKSTVAKYLQYVFSDEGQKIVPEVGYVPVKDVDPDLDSKQISEAANYST